MPSAQTAPLPPRANAIATLVTTDDFLPGAQTLLYSIKKTLTPTPKTEYPPEIIVLVTPNVSTSTRNALHPTFCTRIVQVEPIPLPNNNDKNDDDDSNNKSGSHVESWDVNCGLTKLHIFNLGVYDTILYVDADCLVVKDIGHLFKLGQQQQHTENNDSSSSDSSSEQRQVGLIAAAPDIFPPDKFNAGVLVIRPSTSLFNELITASSLPSFESYDGGDTGFLNAFYPKWFTTMPSSSRLSFGYNAQRFLHHCTYKKQPKYWDLGIGDENLHVIHYSSSPKPWEMSDKDTGGDNSKADAKAMLSEKDVQTMEQSGKSDKLEQMWKRRYKQSKDYAIRCEEDRIKKKREEEEEKLAKKRLKSSAAGASANAGPPRPQNTKEMHKLVTKRYKELRKTGMGVKEAMAAARKEFGADKDDDNAPDPGSQVAAMFGMPM